MTTAYVARTSLTDDVDWFIVTDNRDCIPPDAKWVQQYEVDDAVLDALIRGWEADGFAVTIDVEAYHFDSAGKES